MTYRIVIDDPDGDRYYLSFWREDPLNLPGLVTRDHDHVPVPTLRYESWYEAIGAALYVHWHYPDAAVWTEEVDAHTGEPG